MTFTSSIGVYPEQHNFMIPLLLIIIKFFELYIIIMLYIMISKCSYHFFFFLFLFSLNPSLNYIIKGNPIVFFSINKVSDISYSLIFLLLKSHFNNIHVF